MDALDRSIILVLVLALFASAFVQYMKLRHAWAKENRKVRLYEEMSLVSDVDGLHTE